jgi:hypothetical protein
MNHWLKKKQQREVNQAYIDYANDYFNHMGMCTRSDQVEHFKYQKSEVDIWKLIASGYIPQL